jgi:predicted lipid-binding transport protein (Tim44 family)
MRQTIKRGAVAVRGLSKSRPREVRWSIGGAAVGALAGIFLGGVGIAALGTAFGVPAFVILAIVGGMIGNRVGVEKDNKARSNEAAN